MQIIFLLCRNEAGSAIPSLLEAATRAARVKEHVNEAPALE
jgi:hypothetical protein